MTAVRNNPSSPPGTAELSVTRTSGRRAWLSASGELDLSTAHSLGQLLESQRVAGRAMVRLDVSHVTFMDGVCLGILLRAHHALLAARGMLILVDVGERIEHLLMITGLDQTFFYTKTPYDPSTRPFAG
jgi:anti-anti-sigma factor